MEQLLVRYQNKWEEASLKCTLVMWVSRGECSEEFSLQIVVR